MVIKVARRICNAKASERYRVTPPNKVVSSNGKTLDCRSKNRSSILRTTATKADCFTLLLAVSSVSSMVERLFYKQDTKVRFLHGAPNENTSKFILLRTLGNFSAN